MSSVDRTDIQLLFSVLFPAICQISLKEFSVLCRAFCLFDSCFRLIRSNFFPFIDEFLALFIEF